MFVVLSYDVNSRRLKKTLKVCRKYLNHTQKSVFDGEITEANLEKLKNELKKAVSTDDDSICIYKTESTKNIIKQQLGKVSDNSHII